MKRLAVMIVPMAMVAIAALTVGCNDDDSEPAVSNDQYAVYDALFSQEILEPRRVTGPLVILSETSFHGVGRVEVLEHFTHVDSAVVDSLLSLNARAERLDQESFSIPATLIDTDRLNQYYPTWDKFHRDFPGSGGVALFVSRVAFNGDKTSALVYWSYTCGGLCGDGVVAQLERVDGQWSVVDSLVVWIS
jgi:hypothetical protein